MSELAICTEGLVKQYPGVRAVDGLDLRVPRGAVYGFLGRNGAGKTTTIKVLGGLARATAGSARVLGLDVRAQRLAILERTAFVGERKALYDSLTTAELLRFTRGFYGRWSTARRTTCVCSNWPGTSASESSPAATAPASACCWRWHRRPSCWCSTSRPRAWTPG